MPLRRSIPITLVVFLVAAGLIRWWGGQLLLEKCLTGLAMPFSLCWLGSLALCLIARSRNDKVFFRVTACGVIVLLLLGNKWLAKCAMLSLERPYVGMNAFEEPPFDCLIVLGGGATVGPDGSEQLGNLGGDRIMTAARLYHAGQVERFICTGSKVPGIDRIGANQGDLSAKLIGDLGVPSEIIEIVSGKTTYLEMQELAARINPEERVGLITSAFHMTRALRLAKRAGLSLHPVATDFHSTPDMRPTVRDFIPSGVGPRMFDTVAKELLARLVGR